MLERHGCRTTDHFAGFAFSIGRPDSSAAVPLEASLAHFAELAAASDLPVNADFQNGYADTPAGVGENVRRCVETGVAGLSIEDSTGDPRRPLYDLDEAVARVKAARAAIDASGTGVLLTARAECHLVGTPEPLKDSIRRLRAYAEAGADVLYAPGPHEGKDIKANVKQAAAAIRRPRPRTPDASPAWRSSGLTLKISCIVFTYDAWSYAIMLL